jgi:fused signal recognition particle receptor
MELGLMRRLRDRLDKTRSALADNVKRIFGGRTQIDEDVFNELEELLIEADVGVDTTLGIVEDMRRIARDRGLSDPEALYEVLKEEIVALLDPGDHTLCWDAPSKPHITLIAGVNGSGKTTTAGKLAAKLIADGHSVVLGAADTFRAAAAEQLTIWSQRTGAAIVKHAEGADPASVAFDTTDAAIARGADNVIIDTAGRLHTKVNLMEEMKKIQRVIRKRLPDAPHEVLLVLDATTGQNGLQQARLFTEALHVTGIVLTKLDGTAKGGMIVAIQKELGIPIKLIGVGEGVDDLQPFEARAFVNALFE